MDYRNGVAVKSWNLVWGRMSEQDEEVLHGAYAKQTPRVQTIEKAHIERAYVNQYPEDVARIEEWGRLAQELIVSLIVPARSDPFEGRAVVWSFRPDERSSLGVDVPHQPSHEPEQENSERMNNEN